MSNVISKPWGSEVVLTEPNLPYTGKILKVLAGKRLSLQYHDQKTETLTLISGSAKIILNDTIVDMLPNQGYTIFPGTKHRVEAITDCQLFEVSTPEVGTTYRLEDDYHRSDEVLRSKID